MGGLDQSGNSKIIPMLTDPKNDVVFEMIVPSIPGYGYSEASHKPGLDQADTARIFKKLMQRLGHEKFYAQGGDWGALIVTLLSQMYPENVLGVHSNMPGAINNPRSILKQLFGALCPVTVFGSQEEADLFYPWLPKFINILQETGYFHLQATKPDTIGMGLNDSPLALGAYILEKFGAWSNMKYRELPDGGITKKFTLDELLTNVMIYWTNENIASSQRFYKEFFANEDVQAMNLCGTHVPAGVALFPEEIVVTPRALVVETFRNLVHYSVMPRGGHFAAFEEPRLLADEVITFVKKVEALKTVKKEEL